MLPDASSVTVLMVLGDQTWTHRLGSGNKNTRMFTRREGAGLETVWLDIEPRILAAAHTHRHVGPWSRRRLFCVIQSQWWSVLTSLDLYFCTLARLRVVTWCEFYPFHQRETENKHTSYKALKIIRMKAAKRRSKVIAVLLSLPLSIEDVSLSLSVWNYTVKYHEFQLRWEDVKQPLPAKQTWKYISW